MIARPFPARYAYARANKFSRSERLGGFGSWIAPARVCANLADAGTGGFGKSAFKSERHKLNEVRFGYSRYRTSFSSLDANFDPSSLGIDFGTGKLGLPEIDFGGTFDNLGATAFSVPRGRTSQSFQILDNFTWEAAGTPSNLEASFAAPSRQFQ